MKKPQAESFASKFKTQWPELTIGLIEPIRPRPGGHGYGVSLTLPKEYGSRTIKLTSLLDLDGLIEMYDGIFGDRV